MSEDTYFKDENIKYTYGPDGGLRNWGESRRELSKYISNALAGILLENGIVGEEISPKVLFSPSANTGNIESGLKKKLGNKIDVYIGDLSKVKPRDKKIPFARLNARNLPLPNSSIDILLDLEGAAWYSVVEVSGYNEIETLFKEYRRVLTPNGVVIVDGATASNMENKDIDLEDFEMKIEEIYSPEIGVYSAGILRRVDKLADPVKNG